MTNGQDDWRERMKRLEERHEALTQTVEIIASMQRENEVQISRLVAAQDRLTVSQDRLTASQDWLTTSQAKNEILLAQVIESIDSLARVARSHEQRLAGLEGLQ